ncbi:Protein of unknown function [Palleronia salina]|uniref:DUF1523 domain-containing protein n=2 Tax=Palleronia TaxID=315422 RepID=A0A1M6LH60_9RHOB|nr:MULTISPECIES: DUF1523 family protein [Palleronia]SEO03612.1 Protein of unknown function [Palleronia pelagia]SHJ70519.1 Protein of unknown function [Palleronia salina]
MRYVKWTLILGWLLAVFAVLHYTLPQRDIVRIVNTEIRRMDFGTNSIFWAGGDTGSGEAGVNRDIRFIEAVNPDGSPQVYRNEDTGWGWPPYFKLDSSDLQAQAADLISTRDAPVWVAVTHYGWRSQLLTTFPNAVKVRQVSGPDASFVPWFNIVFLVVLALIVAILWRTWLNFRRRRIDPLVEDASETWDQVELRAADKRRIWRRWVDRWTGRDKG